MEQQASVAAPEVEPAPFEVVGDNIVVELVEREEVLESGIVLAGVSKKRPPEVVVVGAGPRAQVSIDNGSGDTRRGYDQSYGDKQHRVRVGDVLVVRKHDLLRVELSDDGRELHVLKPTAVLGIMPA